MPRLVSFSPHSASASSEGEEPERASCILRKTYGLHDGCFDLMLKSLGKNTCHPGTTSGRCAHECILFEENKGQREVIYPRPHS